MLQMKIVKGERAMTELLQRMRPGCDIRFCENTGHCDDITIYKRYYHDKNQPREGYCQFFVLTMDHQKGWTNSFDVCDIAYLAVTGTMKDLEHGEWREKNLRERYPDLDRRINQLTW